MVLVRDGGSVGRPVLFAESVQPPGPGTRHNARVRPGVSKECGSRLSMWREAVRPLYVDTAANKPVLGALSVTATMCKPIEICAALHSILLQTCGGVVDYLVPDVVFSFVAPHINVARVRYWFGDVKGCPRFHFCYRCFALAPRSTWRWAVICKQKSSAPITLAPSHKRG